MNGKTSILGNVLHIPFLFFAFQTKYFFSITPKQGYLLTVRTDKRTALEKETILYRILTKKQVKQFLSLTIETAIILRGNNSIYSASVTRRTRRNENTVLED